MSAKPHLELVDNAMDKPVNNVVQKPAPSVECLPFKVIENRFDPENSQLALEYASQWLNDRKNIDAPWLMERRKSALELLTKQGLPTPRLERWKYTNLRTLNKLMENLPLKAEKAGRDKLPDSYSPLRAVFIDGQFQADASNLPNGIEICGSWAAEQDKIEQLWNDATSESFNDQMQWALNTLYASDGFVVHVPKNMILEHSIEVIYCTRTSHQFMPRSLVSLGDNAQATLIERHVNQSGQTQLTNTATVIKIGQNAKLLHHKFQDHNEGDLVLGTTHITQARDSRYFAYAVHAGKEAVQRQQIWAQLQGENIDCQLNGVQLSREKQQLETVILMNHEAPHCTSNQDFRHIASDDSSCHFQGKVHVFQAAQLTEAFQMSRGVLLSERAEINTKPELEIYADDVKCSHGATTGQIDDTALFYMRSRGLNEHESRKMLLTSFASEVFESLDENDSMLDAHQQVIAKYMAEVVS